MTNGHCFVANESRPSLYYRIFQNLTLTYKLKLMSFYEFFHKFFEDFQGDNNFRSPGNEEHYGFNKPRDPSTWTPRNEENDTRDFISTFTLTPDLFEMQKLFEQQFSEVFKIFGIPEEFFGFHGPGVMQPPSIPTIEGTDPRDHYLKPEYRHEAQPKVNTLEEELDKRSKSRSSWLDNLLPGVDSSYSISRTTVRLPDGTVKTKEIIRNPDGTEERTESETVPDGSSPRNFDSPFVEPGFFNLPKMPKITSIDPRDQFLKPGFEKSNPFEEKADKDLDKQILQSGVKILPPFSEEDTIVQGKQQSTFRKVKKVTLPNGVVECEEVVRNPDGTEQRTVTQSFPDGTNKIITGSQVIREENTNYRATAFTEVIKDLINVLFK